MITTARPLYVEALRVGDTERATAVALGLLSDGMPAESVLTGLLGWGQQEVGHQWQRALWGVDDEHRATAVAGAVLTRVVEVATSTSSGPVGGSSARVYIACVEGERHEFPARLAEAVLRLRGAEVTVVPLSVPSGGLVEFFAADAVPGRTFAVGLSCAMPSSLVGAWRTTGVLRAAGIPVVCGGRGFGRDGRWAHAVGADMWAPDLSAGADMLLAAATSRAHQAPARHRSPRLIAEIVAAAGDVDGLVDIAMDRVMVQWPDLAQDTARAEAVRRDLVTTLRTVMSAALVHDPALVLGYTEWFADYLRQRSLSLTHMSVVFQALMEALPHDLVQLRDFAEVGVEASAHPS